MLTCIQASVTNDPYACSLVISATVASGAANLSQVSKVKIRKRTHGTLTWTPIAEFDIASSSDLNFTLRDILVKSGTAYDYMIHLNSSAAELEYGEISNVACKFHGLFVGNFEKQYVAGSNFQTTTSRNGAVEYVATLSGRCPFRVSNGNLNYVTGTSKGLFLKLTSDQKRFVPDTYHTHANEVLAFLSDGQGKILKTHDGQMWYVGIDGKPHESDNEFMGAHTIEFAWTEIGDVPTSGLVGI